MTIIKKLIYNLNPLTLLALSLLHLTIHKMKKIVPESVIKITLNLLNT